MEIMQSGRLNYAYRLSAARLVILRMRLVRRWQRFLQKSSSSSRAGALHGLATLMIVGVVLFSAWLGYRAGQRAVVNPISLTDTRSLIEHNQNAAQKTSAIVAIEQSPAATATLATVPEVSVSHDPEQDVHQAEVARRFELTHLHNTVDKLQAQVSRLEQERSDLELELLDHQLAFAEAEEQWNEASVERRVVYNFTNIPVGGFVTKERIESDAERAKYPVLAIDVNNQVEGIEDDTDLYGQYINSEADSYLADMPDPYESDLNSDTVSQAGGANDERGRGPAERFLSFESPASAGLPSDNPARQDIFFGPAEDQFDDWSEQ